MSLHHSFRRWFSSRRSPIRKRPGREESRVRLGLEQLEDRLAPAGTTLSGTAGGTLTIAITGADTVNVSVNGTGRLVINDATTSVTDSTTGSLFGGGTAATKTETATLVTNNFTAIQFTGDASIQTVNIIGGSFTDPNNVSERRKTT